VKCPKCGYIGFETADKCRNCGYEFSLAVREAEPAPIEVSTPVATDGPLADLVLTATPLPSERRGPSGSRDLDLDRIIGAPEAAADLPLFDQASGRPLPSLASRAPGGRTAVVRTPVTPPATPRRPLSVRRSTPEPSRFRSHEPDPRPGRNLELPLPAARATAEEPAAAAAGPRADAGARLLAALTDAGLLLAIDALVVYFTLRLCALAPGEVMLLPPAPLAAFFVLLNGGYLLAFTAATGQTIGKMAFGLKVVAADGDLTPLTAAVRAAGCLVSAATLGAGLLPALFGGRALHDRLAGTDVVRVTE